MHKQQIPPHPRRIRLKAMVASISFFILIFAITLHRDITFAGGFEFGYSGAMGPEKWGSMYKDWKACSDGKQQSPVDIVTDKLKVNKNLKPLAREYKPANATLINFGFNIALRFEEDKVGAMLVDGKKFTLKQLHWHTPSEHLIDGLKQPAELHLLHVADDGSIAVVALLFQIGSNNKFVKKITRGLKKLAKEVCKGNEQAEIALGDLDPKPLMKNVDRYYRYMGSFTTPPCSENVTWTVLGQVEEISERQIEILKAPREDETYYNNSRPVQPLNGRVIELCDQLIR